MNRGQRGASSHPPGGAAVLLSHNLHCPGTSSCCKSFHLAVFSHFSFYFGFSFVLS